MSELDSETHELLRKARQGTPPLPPEVRNRVRGAVMTGAGLATVAAGVSFAKVAVIGVVAASVASVATFTATKQSFEQRASAAEQRASAAEQRAIAAEQRAIAAEQSPGAPATEPLGLVEAVTEAPVPELPRVAPAPPRAIDAAPKPPATPPVASMTERVVDERSLAAELETLEGILHATDAANWSEARVRLGAYHSRFEDGHLRIEARALEVLTLCGEHHIDAARALREELTKVEPLNPAVLRLSASCAAE